jgi:hypothetical protein
VLLVVSYRHGGRIVRRHEHAADNRRFQSLLESGSWWQAQLAQSHPDFDPTPDPSNRMASKDRQFHTKHKGEGVGWGRGGHF